MGKLTDQGSRRVQWAVLAVLAAVVLVLILVTGLRQRPDSATPSSESESTTTARVGVEEGSTAAPGSQVTRAAEPEPPLENPLPELISEQEYREELKLLAMKKELPVHPWHAERVETIAKEDVAQLIENLANFDDVHLADSSSPMDAGPGEAEGEMWVMTHLFRVRRLLDMGRKAPGPIVAAMRRALRESLAAWPEAFRQELALWVDAGNHSLHSSEPTTHDQVRARALVATYFLAELQSHRSLPLLYESYRLQKKWIAQIPLEKYRYLPQCPVAPAIALYAMHRLVMTYPLDGLTPQAQAAHGTYMAWTDQHLRRSRPRIGVKWDADYDESDPLLKVVDRDGVLVRSQPTMELYQYPTFFKDRTPMQGYPAAPYITDKCREWATLMEGFLDLALPGGDER